LLALGAPARSLFDDEEAEPAAAAAAEAAAAADELELGLRRSYLTEAVLSNTGFERRLSTWLALLSVVLPTAAMLLALVSTMAFKASRDSSQRRSRLRFILRALRLSCYNVESNNV